MARCGSCGRPIQWIRLQNGKAMPVDASPVLAIVRNSRGPHQVVTDAGEVVRGDAAVRSTETVNGRISHFATCPNPGLHRRRG